MRITVLIIGLLLGLLMFIQSLALNILSDVGNDESSEGAAAAGVLVAFMWLAACAFVIPLPVVSTILFLLAGGIGLIIASTSIYEDMATWGLISIFLALLSYFGWRGKRKDRREQQAEQQRQIDHDKRMEQLLASQTSQITPESTTAPTSCPTCGHTNAPWTKFCAECGTSLANAAAQI